MGILVYVCLIWVIFASTDLEATPLVDETKTLEGLILLVCPFSYKVYNNTNCFFFMHTSTSVNNIKNVFFY